MFCFISAIFFLISLFMVIIQTLNFPFTILTVSFTLSIVSFISHCFLSQMFDDSWLLCHISLGILLRCARACLLYVVASRFPIVTRFLGHCPVFLSPDTPSPFTVHPVGPCHAIQCAVWGEESPLPNCFQCSSPAIDHLKDHVSIASWSSLGSTPNTAPA